MDFTSAIVDLDGTVYRGERLLPGASNGIETLRAAGLDLLFFSNNASRSRETYVEHLREFGLDVAPEEIYSAGIVTVEYLEEHHLEDTVLVIGSAGLREQIEDAGIAVTENPELADVLVASWTTDFDYDDMTAALQAVDEDTVFLGTNRDRTLPQSDGKAIPGSGSIIYSLAAVVGHDPDAILGKPSDIAVERALERLDARAEDCLLIGDRLDTDLAMGERAGMTTVLVLTGVTDRADIEHSDVDPDYVIERLGDIGAVLDVV